jgi:hypothetical protein
VNAWGDAEICHAGIVLPRAGRKDALVEENGEIVLSPGISPAD